jgi:putative endonuclease
MARKRRVRYKGGHIYIVSNPRRTVLYIGVTAYLEKRAAQHAARMGCRFTRKYNCTDLIYYEPFPLIVEAIGREKQLKRWRNAWKLQLIRTMNPTLETLSYEAGV